MGSTCVQRLLAFMAVVEIEQDINLPGTDRPTDRRQPRPHCEIDEIHRLYTLPNDASVT